MSYVRPQPSHSTLRIYPPLIYNSCALQLLPHLRSGWAVDQAIVNEEKRVVIIRFGKDDDSTCMLMDEVLAGVADDIKNFAVIYLVDIGEVPDFNEMYELVRWRVAADARAR